MLVHRLPDASRGGQAWSCGSLLKSLGCLDECPQLALLNEDEEDPTNGKGQRQ
jgi:hypothetical protein